MSAGWWDASLVLVTAVLLAAAFEVGARLNARGAPLHADAAPLYAGWHPHVGPGSVVAVGIAALVVFWGPALAARLPWRPLLVCSYGAALVWTFALAMVEGWRDGLASRLTNGHEYLHEVPGVRDIPEVLRGFSGRILDFQPDSWTTHVSGHPPAALLTFVWMDRLGLGGGGPAALLCVSVGCAAAVAVPVTVRAVAGSAEPARACLPFVVLFPGAVWIGVSADGLFTGVMAVGTACLAVGARTMTLQRRLAAATAWCLAGGVLLGFGLYLSYGLLLFGLIALAATVLASAPRRWWRPLVVACAGVAVVVAAFTAAGFWWVDGYQLVVERYYQGIALERPYGYWVWANLAAFALSVGPVLLVACRRAVHSAWRGSGSVAVAVLALAAAMAVALADLSGLSKAEVERIWMPFGVWVLVAAGALPWRARHGWLAVQAATALLVNHLFLTYW